MDGIVELTLVFLFLAGIILLCCLIVYILNTLKPVLDKKKKERLLLQAKIQEEKKELGKKIEEERIRIAMEKKQREDLINRQKNILYSQLIHEIEICTDEKPCPKCNELEVLILSLSPNARSMSVNCKHCQHEYRIKMQPDNPTRIITLFNSYLQTINSIPSNSRWFPVWKMEIKRRQFSNQRVPIPTDVKKAVWKRDGGKCVKCGSDVDLQYDHIIPVSKGGSSTVQNIQILCQKCNLRKRASIE